MLLDLIKILKLTVVRKNNVVAEYKINIKNKNKKNTENIHFFEKYRV
ncbi:hypothetical protein GCM10009597_32470 [Peribacillus frigoritolerans]